MSNEMKKKDNKKMFFDEGELPEMPKELSEKLYEISKPYGYKPTIGTQKLADFTSRDNKDKDNHFLREELNKAIDVIKKAVLILEDGGMDSTENALKVLNTINDRSSDID